MSKHLFIAATIAAAWLVTLGVHAAPQRPGVADPRPAGTAPQALPLPAYGAAAVQPLAQGPVQRLLMNPYGEVDGLRLADGTIVKFPPHMSPSITAAVKVGDAVRVIGRAEARGVVAAEAIVNVGSGQTVYDQGPTAGGPPPMAPHLRAANLQPQQVEGRVEAVLTGPRGETNGVILTDGSIVRFPPESLQTAIQPGAQFAATGLGTRNAMGLSLEAVRVGTSLASLQPLPPRSP